MSDSPPNLKSHDDSVPPLNDASDQSSNSVEELRSLLLGKDFDDRIESCRVTPKTVANLLPEAITLTTHAQSEPMVGAVRPMVENAIKESINQDQEILADTLFPIIGPATRKAVTTAIKNLTDSLNQGLEMSLSPQSVGWRFEAWRTGRSFAEVALLRSLLFQVEQVLLIHKETGLMLKDIVAATVIVQDSELVSAMLTAIEDFVKDSFQTKGSSFLDTVEISELNLWIEDGPQAVLACVIRGNAPKSLRTQMQKVLERIHRQYDPLLKDFSGDRTPFESTETDLKTCLISQAKPAPQKKRSPLFWIAGVLLIGLLILLGRSIYLQHQWKSALHKLDEQPGITILKTHRGWSNSQIEGLRDPLAVSPQSILENYDIEADKIQLRFEPYWSLSPKLLEDHAKEVLESPPGITFKYNPQTLTLSLSGKASQQWISRAKQFSQTQQRIDSVDTQGLDILESEKLLKLKSKVESITFTFKEGSSDFNATDAPKFEQFVQTLIAMTQLSEQIQQPLIIHILGQASPTGQFEDNARLSQSRADLIMRRLIQKGIPAQFIKAQGISVTSDSINKSAIPKAQVTFQVDLQQP